jgi:gliding motility-associated-like protein
MLRLLHSLFFVVFCLPIAMLAQQDINVASGPTGCDDVNTTSVNCSLEELDGFMGSMESTPPDAPPCPLITDCGGGTSCDNNVWFSFVATGTSLEITITPSNCGPGTSPGSPFGMQGQVFQISDCSTLAGFTGVSNCFSMGGANPNPAPFILFCNGLVPGGIYTVMLDGFGGSTCEFEVSVNDTDPPPTPEMSDIDGPTDLCPGASVTYCIDYIPAFPYIDNYQFSFTGVASLAAPFVAYFDNFPPTQVCVNVNVTGTGIGNISAEGSNACTPEGEEPTSDLDIFAENIETPIEYDTICLNAGGTINWENQLIFSPGTYDATYPNYLGCDSTLTLEVYGCLPLETIFEIVNVCSSELPYEWCDQEIYDNGNYTCETINVECGGCPGLDFLTVFVYQNEAIVLDPDTLTCGPGATMILDGSTSVIEEINGYSEFLWTGPGIISDNTLDIITIDEPGTYTLAVTTVSYIDPDFECTSTYTVEVVEDAAYPDPVNIDGLVEICGPGSLDYTIIPAGTGVAPTGYTWTATGGVLSVVGDVATVDWATSGEICLAAYNICDTSAYTCLNVTVIDLPVVTDILGSAIACETDDMGIYNVLDNGWTYTWTVSNGASFITDATTSQLTVDFTTATADTVDICVIGESECGFSPEYCETVSLTLIPATPTVSGDAIVCVGESTTYSIEDNPFVTGILTTVTDSLGTITLNPNTIEITVEWTTAGNDEVCFEVSNLCGSAVPVCFGVEVVELPTASLTDQTINFCPSGSDEATLDVALTGQGPWDIEVLDQNGIPIDTYNFTASPGEITVAGEGTYSIGTITDMNGCSGTSTGAVTLTPYISPTASLTGSGGICEGSGDCVMLEVALDQEPGWTIEYTIDNVPQAPVSGIMTSPYMLQICQPGAIELTSVVDGNGCEGAASGIVNVENFEVVSVGDITPICDVNGANYQIEFTISGGTGVYTINSSLGITGTLVGNVFTSEPIPSESLYSFEVFDTNNCNVFLVDGVHVCNCVNEVGTMGQGQIEVCDPDVATAIYDPTLEFLPSGDIIEFVMHEGNGLSLVSPIAFNTSPEFSFDLNTMSYGQTYYISAICGEDDGTGTGSVNLADLCIKVSQGTPVVFYEIPDFTVSDNDTICLGESHNIEISFTAGQAPWSVVYTDDVSGTIDTLNGIQDNPYTLTVSPTQLTNYMFTEVFNTYNTAVCSQAKNETVEVEVFEAPSFSNVQTACNDTADGYTVSFEIVGGNPTTYEVLPAGTGSIIGDTMFVSNIIPDGNSYSFELTNGFCGSVIIEDPNPVDCPCLSDVGILVEDSFSACGPVNIGLQYEAAGSEFLDGNDVLAYFLYTDLADIGGSIVQTNGSEPSFDFVAGMTYGTTYYIAAAVGNDDAGLPDLTDPCLDITDGVEVVWYEIPTVTLSGSTDICNGESTDLTLEFTGPTPYTVEIFDGTTSEIITDINTSPYIHTVSPTMNTNYTVFSGSNDNCDLTITGSADIVVNNAPIVVGVDTTINANNTFVTVIIEISGGSLPYVISDANGPIDTINTTQYISADITCGDGYYFVVDDFNNCNPVIVEAASTDCPCITNVGSIVPDQTQVCDGIVSFTYDDTAEALDGNDVVQFILHDGSGIPIQYADGMNSFTFDAALNYGQAYVISAIAGDADLNGDVDFSDPCFSTSGLGEVTFYEVPNAVLSGGGDLCLDDSMDLDVEFTSGVGPWTVALLNDIDNTTTDYTLNNPIDIITLSPIVTTNYSLVSVVDSEGVCAGTVSGSASIQVNTTPVVSNDSVIEDFDSEELVVEFEITGGDQNTYTVVDVNGIQLGTITANQFVSFPFACDQVAGGVNQTFYISDQYNCEVVELEVFLECGCQTSIGDFDTNNTDYCYGDLITFDPITTFEFDGNDVLNYILTDDANNLNTPIAVSQTPEFVFNPNVMDCGVDYFVIGVVGDNLGGGITDLNDQCLAVSAPMTVQVYCEIDFGFVEETITICSGETAFVNTFANVSGLFDLTIIDPVNGSYEILGVEDGDLISFEPQATGIYQLILAVELETGLMCTVDLNDQVEIIVVETGFSGTVATEPVFCEGTDETVLLADLIDGEDAGGAWTAAGSYTGFNPNQGTFSVLGQTAGVYEFTYTVLGQASCPDVSTEVTVTVNPNPVADAGANQTITCNDLIVDLGGSQTSQGGVFSYTWLFNNTVMTDQTASTASVEQAGTYTLIVENSLTGCEATSEVLVDNIVETLIPAITLDDPDCFGANNGSILFSGVDGGQGPYLYSVDGGQNFQSINVFDTLYADSYEIVVMDINGCESQAINVNIEDPEQIFVELELFVAQGGDLNNKEFVEDGIVSYNDTIVIQAQLLNEGVNTNISWYPDDLNDCENCEELSLVATNTMYIEVTVGAAGCQDTDALSIFVEKERPVFVPSIFSPNGDVANDLLEISVGSYVQDIKTFEIYDRWGTKVYEINNFLPAQSGSNYWDGTYKGQNCQSGVYVYFMEVEMIDGSKEVLKGDIALTR